MRPYDCGHDQVGCRPHFGKFSIGTTHHEKLPYNFGGDDSSGCSQKMIFWFLDKDYNLRRRGKAASFVLLVYGNALHSLRYGLSANMAQRLLP